MKGKTSKELVDILVKRILQNGQKIEAMRLDISPQYLSDIVNFKRALSHQVAFKLGYKPKLMWIKREQK